VLVVEDDHQLRTHYRSALKAAGYEVIAVEDGLTALQHVELTPPDAVVLDLGLPRLDGRDVYRELTSNPGTSRIPVVIVTGQPLSDRDLMEFSCVLHKPLHAEALIQQIEQCVRSRGTRL
jgi:DNA-binding response OmpR family regulator